MVFLHKKSNKGPQNEGGRSRVGHRPSSRLATVVVVRGAVVSGELARDAARRQVRRVARGLRLDLSAADGDPLPDGGYTIHCDKEHCESTDMGLVTLPPTWVASSRLDVLAGPGGKIDALGGICEA